MLTLRHMSYFSHVNYFITKTYMMQKMMVLSLLGSLLLSSSFKSPTNSKATIAPFGNYALKAIKKKAIPITAFSSSYALVTCAVSTKVWFMIDPDNPSWINYDLAVGSCETPCHRVELLSQTFTGYYFGWGNGPSECYDCHICEVAPYQYNPPDDLPVYYCIYTNYPYY